MSQTNPADGKENPSIVRAVYEALSHAVVPSSTLPHRRATEGKRYTTTYKQTVTTTQSALYFYIENNQNDDSNLQLEPASIYVGAEFDTVTYKNATVDTATFTQDTFNNVKTGSTSTPDANVFVGTDDSTTISDKGTPIIDSTLGSGKETFGRSEMHAIAIIEPGDNVLIELNNQSGSDQKVSATFWSHNSAPYEPDLL